jgi:hypothetical protein
MRLANKGFGERPLRFQKEEAYAQERAFGHGMRESARRAGLDDYTGIQSKYERKLRVQRRIAWLRRDDLTNEFHQEKRRRLEQRLDRSAFGNFFDYVVIGDDGKPRIDWKVLMVSELGPSIAELRCDKDTGVIVNVTRESALNAIGQLREMRGFKAADHHRVELSAIGQLTDEELLRIAAQAALPSPPALIEAQPERQGDDDDDDDRESD